MSVARIDRDQDQDQRMGRSAHTDSGTTSAIAIVYEDAGGRPTATGRVKLAGPCCLSPSLEADDRARQNAESAFSELRVLVAMRTGKGRLCSGER